jgi:hypothetical protein
MVLLGDQDFLERIDLGVTIYVHPIDTDAHPMIPPGWRWAVHAGAQPPPDNLERCLNAGWCPTRNEACVEGEAVGTAVAKALGYYLGVPPTSVAYLLYELERDPIPRGVD